MPVLHLLFNYYAVRSVVIPTLNTQRATILIQHFLSASTATLRSKDVGAGASILSPADVSAVEAIFWRDNPIRVRLGAPLRDVLAHIPNSEDPMSVILEAHSSKHLLAVRLGPTPTVLVALRAGIPAFEILRAYMHALRVRRHLVEAMAAGRVRGCGGFGEDDVAEAMRMGAEGLHSDFVMLVQGARERGWRVDDRCRLRTEEWRWDVVEGELDTDGGKISRHLTSSSTRAAASPTEAGYYNYWLPIQTRWNDNDQYGHVNNAVVYQYFDTVVNVFLRRVAKHDPVTSPVRGLVVNSQCNYHKPFSYPSVVKAGLSVLKIGNSSVTYSIGIFSDGSPDAPAPSEDAAPPASTGGKDGYECCASGTFTHVFVDASTGKPIPIPDGIRGKYEGILVASK
ncbi:hypothetical protein HK101_004855 [Irineochytrium annulatum]|nr:hypothetical protein HK101_004855 [Irineochytrium annulatum]